MTKPLAISALTLITTSTGALAQEAAPPSIESYGTHCGAILGGARASVGDDRMAMSAAGLPALANALLLLSAKRADVAIAGTSCRLLTDPALYVPLRVSAAGSVSTKLAVPKNADLSLFAQVLAADTVAGRLVTTNGLSVGGPTRLRTVSRGGGRDRARQAVPVSIVSLPNGSQARFFAWKDGSAGVLEAGSTGIGAALRASRQPAPTNIADLFWAVAEPGAPVPDLLALHDARVVGQPTRAPRSKPQGWLRPMLTRQPAATCSNSSIYWGYCAASSTFPSGPGCFYNTNGTLSWTTGKTTRFRAKFCLDRGKAKSYLYFQPLWNQNGQCYSFRTATYIWGLLTPTYNAYTSWGWTWIGPSGASKRKWRHWASGQSSDARYDWATKFKSSSNCNKI